MEGQPNKKRSNESAEFSRKRNEEQHEDNDEMAFEDPFGDEFEEEVFEDDGLDEDEEDGDDMNVDDDEGEEAPKLVWRPGIDTLAEGETLEYDPSAYVMYHALRTEWPCLSFDFLRDTLGEGRQRFPLTMFMVTGSQADKADKNKITLLKLSDLYKTQQFDSDDDENHDDDDDDENMDDDPVMEHAHFAHHGGVNRVRSMPQHPGIVATMADTGAAHIYDLTPTYQAFLDPTSTTSSLAGISSNNSANNRLMYTFRGHKSEGYGLDWNPNIAGRIATGDCNGVIQIWNIENINSTSASTLSASSSTEFRGHVSSVEDIQWSPNEGTVFTSASADKTIRVWDTRGKGPQITVSNAHNEDVNVISWNRKVNYLLSSGSDDGSFKVWDLRALRQGTTLANFNYHKSPITSIEWAPHDESVLALSSSDNQVTIWDLSVESDDATTMANNSNNNNSSNNNNNNSAAALLAQYPAQLLFIHQGQSNVKEVHHHPHIPGVIVSTAEDGFNAFKPAISVSS